jgi:hypothetical protein
MARRNIYLTDDLDKRVRAAIDARQLDASDVCAAALGRALNGQEAGGEHQAVTDQLGSHLDLIEQRLGQLPGQVSDMKRVIVEAAAVIFGVCVLLAAGLALYLRPPSTA